MPLRTASTRAGAAPAAKNRMPPKTDFSQTTLAIAAAGPRSSVVKQPTIAAAPDFDLTTTCIAAPWLSRHTNASSSGCQSRSRRSPGYRVVRAAAKLSKASRLPSFSSILTSHSRARAVPEAFAASIASPRSLLGGSSSFLLLVGWSSAIVALDPIVPEPAGSSRKLASPR